MALILHGIGMYTMTDSMLMYSQPILILCGGIGDGIGVWQVLAGAGVGDGALLIIIAGILLIGMAAGTTRIGDRDGVVRITIITDITDGLATTV